MNTNNTARITLAAEWENEAIAEQAAARRERTGRSAS